MKPGNIRRMCWLSLVWLWPGMASLSWAGELVGVLDWNREVTLGVLEPGVIQTVRVVPGQRVRRGELLLALDRQAQKADLAAARVRLQLAQARLEEARREFERAEDLYERTVLSDHERIVAHIGLLEAKAAVASAEANRARAARALAHSVLQAPFDGLVVQVDARPGQAVNGALKVPELVVLADDHRLRVRLWVDAVTLDALKAAQALHVELAGRRLPVRDIVAGFEARRQAGGDEARIPVAVVVERPADLEARAGLPARVSW